MIRPDEINFDETRSDLWMCEDDRVYLRDNLKKVDWDSENAYVGGRMPDGRSVTIKIDECDDLDYSVKTVDIVLKKLEIKYFVFITESWGD